MTQPENENSLRSPGVKPADIALNAESATNSAYRAAVMVTMAIEGMQGSGCQITHEEWEAVKHYARKVRNAIAELADGIEERRFVIVDNGPQSLA